ncbi:MAG: phosphatidylglycerophosphatase A [Planctomycetota bacterium]|nr:phosphatidylglycerophosphatase A [Planctomycetota bacterium]
MGRIKLLIATGLGTGYLPVAPGTWASAAAAGVFLLVSWGSKANPYCLAGTMAGMVVLASVACVALGGFTEKRFGKKDPSYCTLDEWAGQALAYLFLPLAAGWQNWLIVAGVGFFAFRIFDILKPPPARRLEKLPLGWGILADDLVAGVYANLLSQVIVRFGFG